MVEGLIIVPFDQLFINNLMILFNTSSKYHTNDNTCN